MSLSRLGAAAFLAAVLAAPGARGEGGKEAAFEGEKKPSKQGADAAMKDPKADAYAAMMKKKFLACKEFNDCKPYMDEKEKARKKKANSDQAPSKPEAKPDAARPPQKPAEEESSPAEPPEAAASLAEPLEAAGSLAGPAGAAPPTGPPPTVEQAEARRQEAGQRRARTMTRAAGAADSMRRSFFPTEEPAPGGAGDPGGADRRTSASPDEPRPAFIPAEPRTVPEMALAARTGFAATFRDQGLQVGAGPRGKPAIQRLDGAPASAADVERLGAALRSDPAALMRRPDFFEVLPREKFLDLKQDYAARPELRTSAFKDIGMTPRARDFQWSSSCSGLSGACNAHAGRDSYRKGHDVPPEDLDAVWNAVQEEVMESDDEFGEYTEEDFQLAAAADLAEEKLGSGRRSAPSLASLLARMGELARGAGESAGFISPRAAPPSPAEGPADAGGGALNVGFAGAPARAAAAAPGSVPSASPAPEGGRAKRSGRLVYVLAAAAAAALILRGLRRNG